MRTKHWRFSSGWLNPLYQWSSDFGRKATQCCHFACLLVTTWSFDHTFTSASRMLLGHPLLERWNFDIIHEVLLSWYEMVHIPEETALLITRFETWILQVDIFPNGDGALTNVNLAFGISLSAHLRTEHKVHSDRLDLLWLSRVNQLI